MITVYRQHCP